MTTTVTSNAPTLSKTHIGLYFVVMGAIGISGIIVGPTLPYLADQVQVSLDQISVLFLVRSLGGMLGALVISRLYDRLPGHWLLGAALGVTGGLSLLLPAVGTLPVLLGISFVLGVCDAMMHVGANTLLMWGLGDRLGPALNGMHFMFGIGAILSPLLVRQSLLLTAGIGLAYYVVAAVMLLLAVGAQFFTSPSDPQGATQGATLVNRRIPGLAYLFVLFFVAYVGGEVGFASWLYTYALETGIADALNAASLNSLFWLTFTIGRLLAVPLSARFRPRILIWANLTVVITALLSMLLAPGLFWWSVALLGLGYASMFPQAMTWVQRRLNVTGKINGLFLGGVNFSAMLIPWIDGLLFTGVGPHSLIWATLGMACLILVMVVLLTVTISDQPAVVSGETI